MSTTGWFSVPILTGYNVLTSFCMLTYRCFSSVRAYVRDIIRVGRFLITTWSVSMEQLTTQPQWNLHCYYTIHILYLWCIDAKFWLHIDMKSFYLQLCCYFLTKITLPDVQINILLVWPLMACYVHSSQHTKIGYSFRWVYQRLCTNENQ